MSTLAPPLLITFRGQARFAFPGIEFNIATVATDLDTPKPFRSTWPKATAWLIQNGYRQLFRTPVKRDGVDVTLWWGKTAVFGETTTFTDSRDIRDFLRQHLTNLAAADNAP